MSDTPTILNALIGFVVAMLMLVILFFGVRLANAGEPVIAVIARVCLRDDCHEKVVMTSEQNPRINMISCQIGQAALAEWLGREWPGYTLAGWKCVDGQRGASL